MNFIDKETGNMYETKQKASSTAKTALGLSIGAIGIELLKGGLGNLGGILGGGSAPVAAVVAEEANCAMQLANNNAMWQLAYGGQNARFNDRQVLNSELFGLYSQSIAADFEIYKTTRDGFDITNARVSDLEKEVAVLRATRPYQDALIACEIKNVADVAAYNLERRTCRMITGEVVLPTTSTVSGYPSSTEC